MRRVYSTLLALPLLLGVSGQVLANGVDASVTVTPVPDSVSRSRTAASPGYASYQVTVTNVNDDLLRIVQLKGDTKVLNDIDPQPSADAKANFVSATGLTANAGGVTCALRSSMLPPDATAILCSIGVDLQPYQSLSFVVVFTVPTAGDKITFKTDTVYAEYEHSESYVGTATPVLNDLESIYRTASTRLEALNGLKAKTYVPANTATSLATGATGSAITADTLTTNLNIPPTSATTATITEDESESSPDCAGILRCRLSRLSIPGFLAPDTAPIVTLSTLSSTMPPPDLSSLLIGKFRIDVSLTGPVTTAMTMSYSYYKPKSLSINNAVIDYLADPSPTVPAPYITQVPNCAKDRYGNAYPMPGLPSEQLPCIAKREVLGSKTMVPADDKGDWEFTLWFRKNGLVRIKPAG